MRLDKVQVVSWFGYLLNWIEMLPWRWVLLTSQQWSAGGAGWLHTQRTFPTLGCAQPFPELEHLCWGSSGGATTYPQRGLLLQTLLYPTLPWGATSQLSRLRGQELSERSSATKHCTDHFNHTFLRHCEAAICLLLPLFVPGFHLLSKPFCKHWALHCNSCCGRTQKKLQHPSKPSLTRESAHTSVKAAIKIQIFISELILGVQPKIYSATSIPPGNKSNSASSKHHFEFFFNLHACCLVHDFVWQCQMMICI